MVQIQMNETKKKQQKAIRYYDKISVVYDFISNWYYKKARNYAIEELELEKGQTVLNIPCGTGVNFKYFQSILKNSGLIIGIDLSSGMLGKANQKIERNRWENIETELNDATKVNQKWLEEFNERGKPIVIDTVFFAISGFRDCQNGKI